MPVGRRLCVRPRYLQRNARAEVQPGSFVRAARTRSPGSQPSLDFGEGGLNLRRARTTWLTAHLLAGTSLPSLRVLAGSLSAQTLIELIDLMVDEVDPEQAIQEGLRA